MTVHKTLQGFFFNKIDLLKNRKLLDTTAAGITEQHLTTTLLNFIIIHSKS